MLEDLEGVLTAGFEESGEQPEIFFGCSPVLESYGECVGSCAWIAVSEVDVEQQGKVLVAQFGCSGGVAEVKSLSESVGGPDGIFVLHGEAHQCDGAQRFNNES